MAHSSGILIARTSGCWRGVRETPVFRRAIAMLRFKSRSAPHVPWIASLDQEPGRSRGRRRLHLNAPGRGPEELTDSQRHRSHEFSANCLDKIRKLCYVFSYSESPSRSPKDRREDEKPWLFETLAHNLLREPRGGATF
jgi:hypothetical protein